MPVPGKSPWRKMAPVARIDVQKEVGDKRSMALGEMMQHAAIHGVHHRGQVALLLRLLGHVPGNFDMLFYYADKRNVPAW